jgi:hypothetical protein
MGNSVSTSNLTRKSMRQCIDEEGDFDEELYALYRRAKRQKTKQEELNLLDECTCLAAEEMEFTPPSICKQPCHQKIIDKTRDDVGNLIKVTPKKSSWWYQCVEVPIVKEVKFQQNFHLWFCCK